MIMRETADAGGQVAERAFQCLAVKDIFGNPFRSGTFDPTWKTPTVVQLAQALYEDRHFEDLPVLADALEEAGCTNADILDHLRSHGPHVRGCWPLDLILGRA